jgi:hypothetical protein
MSNEHSPQKQRFTYPTEVEELQREIRELKAQLKATAQASSHDEEIVRAALRYASENAPRKAFICCGSEDCEHPSINDCMASAIFNCSIPAILQQVKAGVK